MEIRQNSLEEHLGYKVYYHDNKPVGYGEVFKITDPHTVKGRTFEVSQTIFATVGTKTDSDISIDQDSFNKLKDPKDPMTLKDFEDKQPASDHSRSNGQ